MLHCFTLHCTLSVHAASACSEKWSGACTVFTAEAWRAAPFLTANTSSPCASRDIPHYDPEQERERTVQQLFIRLPMHHLLLFLTATLPHSTHMAPLSASRHASMKQTCP